MIYSSKDKVKPFKVVEALRSIAEILIWGDQNDSSVFEFFLEKNMFLFFINLLNSEPGNNVCVQVQFKRPRVKLFSFYVELRLFELDEAASNIEYFI